jgi:hypothetical protein
VSKFEELRQRAINVRLEVMGTRSYAQTCALEVDAILAAVREQTAQQIAEAIRRLEDPEGIRELIAKGLFPKPADVVNAPMGGPNESCRECGGAKFVCDPPEHAATGLGGGRSGCRYPPCAANRRPCPECTPKADEKPSKFRGTAKNYVALEHCGCNPSCSLTPGECVCPCEGCRSACAPKSERWGVWCSHPISPGHWTGRTYTHDEATAIADRLTALAGPDRQWKFEPVNDVEAALRGEVPAVKEEPGRKPKTPEQAASTAPDPDRCPLERFTLYWCDSALGIHISGSGGTWNGCRLKPFEAVRADLVDSMRAEDENLKREREHAGRTWEARVVEQSAARDAAIARAEQAEALVRLRESELEGERAHGKYYVKARVYGAIAAEYQKALQAFADRGEALAQAALEWRYSEHGDVPVVAVNEIGRLLDVAQESSKRLAELRDILFALLPHHHGSCCTFYANNKVVVTEASCVCADVEKRARRALYGAGWMSETSPEVKP